MADEEHHDSVDEELYRLATSRAAEQGTTVAALVRELLVRLVREDAEFERLHARQHAILDLIERGYAVSGGVGPDTVQESDTVR